MNTVEQNLRIEISALVSTYAVIKTEENLYEFHFIPKGCKCGGVVGVGYDFPTVEIALFIALQEARKIAGDGVHYHYNRKVKNEK